MPLGLCPGMLAVTTTPWCARPEQPGLHRLAVDGLCKQFLHGCCFELLSALQRSRVVVLCLCMRCTATVQRAACLQKPCYEEGQSSLLLFG